MTDSEKLGKIREMAKKRFDAMSEVNELELIEMNKYEAGSVMREKYASALMARANEMDTLESLIAIMDR